MNDRSAARRFGLEAVCWLALLLASSMSLAAEDAPESFEAASHVNRNEVQIAEPLTLTIRAAAPPGWMILPPERSDELNGWRVIDSHDQTQPAEHRVVWTRRLTLEGYAPGRKTIAPIEIAFQPPEDGDARAEPRQTKRLQTEALILRVRSALSFFESGSELRPIDEAVAVPWSYGQWVLATVTLAIVAGCAVRAVRWVNRFHDEANLSKRKSVPKSLARELYRLREAWLVGKSNDAETVAAAAEIARRHLGWREKGSTVYRTSGDWAGRLRRRGEPSCASLVDVLHLADRVKFAEARPTLDEVRQSLERVRLAIDAERARS